MHTLWYHDHRVDNTSQNTYKGLAGMYLLFNDKDTGDELTGFHLPSFPQYDIPMVFNDKVIDPSTGQIFFDLFNLDGILGDRFLVNGKVQPVLHVSPRRYCFRWLNTGPSRFYQFFLTGLTNLSANNTFWQISTDGNLLDKPYQVSSSRVSVSERVDVIVDFTGKAGKTFYIENRLQQSDGQGPSGGLFARGRATCCSVRRRRSRGKQQAEPGQYHRVLRFPERPIRCGPRAPSCSRTGATGRSTGKSSPATTSLQVLKNSTRGGPYKTRVELAPPGPHPLRGIPDLVDQRAGARHLSARPERPQGRGETRVARYARGLLPLPRLPRKISDPLPQRRTRGPRHDGALGNRRVRRRHQPTAVALDVEKETP